MLAIVSYSLVFLSAYSSLLSSPSGGSEAESTASNISQHAPSSSHLRLGYSGRSGGGILGVRAYPQGAAAANNNKAGAALQPRELWADERVREAEETRLAIARMGNAAWLDDNIETCPIGQKLCAIWEGEDTMGCADVQSELEVCGGCPGDLGQDCGELEGVNRVQCIQGSCLISSCLAGYQLSSDATECINLLGSVSDNTTSRDLRRSRSRSKRLGAL